MEFTVETEDRLIVVDVTGRVAEAVPAEANGICTVYVPHTTAGVSVQEADPRLMGDVESFLEEVVPDEGWEHDRIDDNADAHLRALLVGGSVTVPIRDGDLALGTWGSVLFVECNGPQTRTVSVTVASG